MRHLRLAAVFLLLCILSGCVNRFPNANAVRFYYLSEDISYTGSEGVIAPEVRNDLSTTAPLSQLLVQYLSGPSSDDLRSPFPEGVELISTSQEGDTLTLIFNDQLGSLSGMELTLACACITKTSLELTDAVSVSIQAQSTTLDGAAQITMTADSLVLLDSTSQ